MDCALARWYLFTPMRSAKSSDDVRRIGVSEFYRVGDELSQGSASSRFAREERPSGLMTELEPFRR